jgi:flagellar L-ring protein precursor FlgH
MAMPKASAHILASTTLAAILLSGCSTYVQNVVSDDFEPIYQEVVKAPETTPTGSIYSDNGVGLFPSGPTTKEVGDIINITMLETFSATKSSSAASSKADSFDVTLPTGLPNILTGGFEPGSLKSGTAQSFGGSGTASQSNTLTGSMSVTVMRVFTNGNLEIAGQKKLTLTNGDEYVRVRGIIRPQDISQDNVVLSSRIADAEITYIGAGQVGDSVNQGWLSRGLRAISPF